MFRVLEKSSSLTGWFFSNTNDLRSSRTRRLRVNTDPPEEFTDVNSFLRSKPRRLSVMNNRRNRARTDRWKLASRWIFLWRFQSRNAMSAAGGEANACCSSRRYSSINFARNLCSIQKQHSNVSNSMIILLQLKTGRRKTVRRTRRRKAKLL